MKTQTRSTTPRLLLGTAVALMTAASLMGCNKLPETVSAPPQPAVSTRPQIDDAVITASVKAALLAEPGVKSLDISVQTAKGEVQLSGFVNNQSQIDQAGVIARAADGSVSVDNQLKIKP